MADSHTSWLSPALARVVSPIAPRVGLILGSGLGAIAAKIQESVSIPYRDIPGFPVSTAIGHKGQLTLGMLHAVPVAVMEGRFHRYEGYSAEQLARPVRLLQALGVHTLIATNAAGGLHPDFQVGDVVVIRDHINLMGKVARQDACGMSIRDTSIYDETLSLLAIEAVRLAGGRGLRGTYIGMSGPNYETRAEYRFLRTLGDLVGMSTIPEALTARMLGLRVLGLSVVSNACNPDQLEPTDGSLVVAAVATAAERVGRVIQHVISGSSSSVGL